MATIVEVAKRAGVSPSTVSHVVNRTRFVADRTRTRVEAAIASLGYRPNSVARSLRLGQSHTLGLVLPDSANPFFAEVGRELELAAFEAGFTVILCNTEGDLEKERRYLNVLARKQVDGIVLVSAEARGDALHALLARRMPLVVLDREAPGSRVDAVAADHLRGGRLAAEHLLRLGHRRIGCVAGPAHLPSAALRLAGFRRALRDAGLALEARLVHAGDFHPRSGWRAGRALLALPRPPTAVFACNDLMAMGVLRAAAEAGRRVPDDLAVVGHDDIELARYLLPALSTVAQPKRDLGRAAIRLMAARIAAPRRPPRREVLPVSLTVRESCGGAPARRAEGGDRRTSA